MPITALLIMFAGFMVRRAEPGGVVTEPTPPPLYPQVLKSKMGWMLFLYCACPPILLQALSTLTPYSPRSDLDIFGYTINCLAQNEVRSAFARALPFIDYIAPPCAQFYADRYNFVPAGAPAGTPSQGRLYLEFFDQNTDTVWLWGGLLYAIAAIVLVAMWSFWAFSTIRYDRNAGSARNLHVRQGAGASHTCSVPHKPLPFSFQDDAATSPAGDAAGAPVATQPTSDDHAADAPSTRQLVSADATSPVSLRQLIPFDTLTRGATRVVARSVLAFEPMTVAFDGIAYTVQLPRHLGGGAKTLLHGVRGFALPGRMLALMGASGAGESGEGAR